MTQADYCEHCFERTRYEHDHQCPPRISDVALRAKLVQARRWQQEGLEHHYEAFDELFDVVGGLLMRLKAAK